MASSAWKYSLATDSAVTGGFGGISGDLGASGDRGDRTVAELARRIGAAPFAGRRTFSEAFRSRVGVPEREGVRWAEGGLSGVRVVVVTAWGVLGDRGRAAGGSRGEPGGLAGDEAEMDICLRAWTRSGSAPPAVRLA